MTQAIPPDRLTEDRLAEDRLTEDRLTELEIALAHHERLAEELSEVVREQADRLDRLERTLAALARRLDAAGREDTEAPAAHAPPPHW